MGVMDFGKVYLWLIGRGMDKLVGVEVIFTVLITEFKLRRTGFL